MAKEHITSFGPEDILRLVLQCTNCRGELAFTVGPKPPVLTMLNKCPVCFEEWDRDLERFGARKAQLNQLATALDYFKRQQNEVRNGHSWNVRLVIEEEPSGSQ